MTGQLEGRVIIVTGGARGLGRAYVKRLAREGARVVAADIDGAGAESAAAEASGGAAGRALGIRVDVADKESVRAMVQRTVETFGGVDGLVNNAALFATVKHQPIEDISVDEWDEVMAVNVRGVFLCCQAVIPIMKARGWGRIVNIASGTVLGGVPRFLNYVSSKGAVFGLTRGLAREVGPHGIVVNTLAPGLVPTEAALADHDQEMFVTQRRIRAIPRDETPEDLEGALVYLLSDESRFMTGQLLAINGGAQFW